jgi:hypothetical protein
MSAIPTLPPTFALDIPTTDAAAPERGPQSWLSALQRYDAQRPAIPGEHWFALGAGVLLLLAGARSRSPLGRGLKTALGTALIGRAASGRDGLARWLPPKR